MSVKSLWFLNDPLTVEEGEAEKNAEYQDHHSSSISQLSEDSMNSEPSLEPKRQSFLETFDFKIPKIRKESQAFKLMQYFREMNGEVKKGNKKYLSGYFLDKEHTGIKKSLSIDNFDKERMHRTVKEQDDASFSSSEQKTERTPGKVSPTHKPRESFMMTRFRRKSCHCSDCGGASKFELKVQNVIGLHNKQLKTNLLIRKRLQERTAKYLAPFLNLPKANAVVVSTKGRNKNSKKTTVNSMKIAPSIMQNLLALKDKIPRRGAETPLKMNRNTDENKFFNTKEQYSIKIFTPSETDKQITDAQKRESPPKKDSDVAGLNLNDFLKRKKAPPKRKPEESSSHPNSPRALDPSLPRVEELKREDSKSATLVKKLSTKFSDQSLSELPATKKEVPDEIYMNNPIKKERWRPIVTLSPKFKSTLVPQIEDELKQIAERVGKGQTETKGLKTYHVKKAYSGNIKLLPRLKTSHTEKSELFQNKIILPTQEISRCSTEVHDGKIIMNRTAQTAGFHKEVFPIMEGENQFPLGVSSARLTYDFENSPYFKKQMQMSRKSQRVVFGSQEIVKSQNGFTQRRESMSTRYSFSKKSQDEKTSKFIPKLVINTARSSSEYQLPSPTGSFRPSSTTSSFYRKGSMPSINGGRKIVNVSVEKNKKKQTM